MMVEEAKLSVAAALLDALRSVQIEAIPVLVDSLLSSSRLCSSSLLCHLIQIFPDLLKYNVKAQQQFTMTEDLERLLEGFVCTVTHLMRNPASDLGALNSLIWMVYIPIMRMTSKESYLQNQIAEAVSEIAAERKTWREMQLILLPSCLKSVIQSIQLNPANLLSSFSDPCILNTGSLSFSTDTNQEHLQFMDTVLPLYVACELVSRLLVCALDVIDSNKTHLSVDENFAISNYELQLATQIVLDFLEPALKMLTHVSDKTMRQCAMARLLPSILRAVDTCDMYSHDHFDELCFCRVCVMRKVWHCCKTLFVRKSEDRQDAYTCLSLFVDYMLPLCTGDTRDMDRSPIHLFDVRTEKEFWEELRRGLVDSEHLTRKKALHILKTALERRPMFVDCDNSQIIQHELPDNINFKKHDKVKRKSDMEISHKTRRERWAAMEAKSLGVGAIDKNDDKCANRWQRWKAFLVLYEMLEEYGTHLVEAAWTNQVSLLLAPTEMSISGTHQSLMWNHQSEIENTDVSFLWTCVLWQKGFDHGNPQVRRLILQSFLDSNWGKCKNLHTILPRSFVFGPFLKALNDPIHHKDFGTRGIYCSETSTGVARFIRHYSSSFSPSARRTFIVDLLSHAKGLSIGRAGLMTIAHCVKVASCRDEEIVEKDHLEASELSSVKMGCKDNTGDLSSKQEENSALVDALQFLVESSKLHFNPKYRSQVSEHCIKCSSTLLVIQKLDFIRLLSFLSAFPKDFIVKGGVLYSSVRHWFHLQDAIYYDDATVSFKEGICANLSEFAKIFLKPPNFQGSIFYDDEQIGSWLNDAKKWARLLCLEVLTEVQVRQILKVIEKHAFDFFEHGYSSWCMPEKLLVLILALLNEYLSNRGVDGVIQGNSSKSDAEKALWNTQGHCCVISSISDFVGTLIEKLVSYARSSMEIFFSYQLWNEPMPTSLSGKLGGPCQRRLPASATSSVLQAILSLKTVAECTIWLVCFNGAQIRNCIIDLLWDFSWTLVNTPVPQQEVDAEIRLGAFEALASVLKALAVTARSSNYDPVNVAFVYEKVNATMLNKLVMNFLESINFLLEQGLLARSRYSKLLHIKWCCLGSFLSIPLIAIKDSLGRQLDGKCAISDSTLENVICDVTESLQCADEDSLLEMLKCVRWIMKWDLLSRLSGHSSHQIQRKTQIIWLLVQSSWAATCDSHKRKVAPIAVLLSAIFHPCIFSDEYMHVDGCNGEGPLKWFVGKLIEQGARSPRTMRLTALHLTGMWLLYPRIIKYYIKELKVLALHGSVAIDEDLDVELMDSQLSANEYLLLAQNSDRELTEMFLNTEMYVRISVAVLFHKLAEQVENAEQEGNTVSDVLAASMSGKEFLIELMHSAERDADLSKELYKKSSAIHRRKTRAWQMICVLSRFVDKDILASVLRTMHTSLYKNNLPAVRQYIEIFAMNIYLKFPSLVGDDLVPILAEHNLKSQVVSSYVFISVHVLLNVSPTSLQLQLLEELLPSVIPYLTSHHHSLRCFSQILVHRVFDKFMKTEQYSHVKDVTRDTLEKHCLLSMMKYLDGNADCARLRTSVEKYIDAFDPVSSSTPRGIFSLKNRETDYMDDVPFECAPLSVIEHVIQFLNQVRDQLRGSMAEDAATLKSEEIKGKAAVKGEVSSLVENQETKTHIGSDVISSLNSSDFSGQLEKSAEFQRKILSHKVYDSNGQIYDNSVAHLPDMEVEDQLLMSNLESQLKESMKLGGRRHNLIVVASLLGRIPNLAGLARTCEVFKAERLVISDASVVRDKQFQLISVTAEKWVPIVEVPEQNLKEYLNSKKMEGYSLLGLEQTTNSIPLDKYSFPKKTVLILGKEKEGIPVDIIHVLDACVEIPQYGFIRSLNVHVSGAIAIWEYSRQQCK